MYGPSDTWSRLGAASSPDGGEIDDFSDIFDIHHWVDGEPVQFGALDVDAAAGVPPDRVLRHADHRSRPVPSFVYSGDTGVCDQLVDLARDADVFLCEASWTHVAGSPARAASVGHRGRAGRRAGRCSRAAADAHPAVDVA